MTAVEADGLYQAMQSFVGRPVGAPSEARDPVNAPMIRHWCDAMGDDNPVYTDPALAERSVHGSVVAPPTMLQVWNMRGLKRESHPGDGQSGLMALLDGAGYTSVVATDCEQEYTRYLRPGDVLTETGVIESVSPRKRTALGEGYFVTTLRTYLDQAGEPVGTMRFRLLKFRPQARAEEPSSEGPSSEGSAAPAPARAAAAPAAPAAAPPPVPPPPPVPHPAVNRDTAFFWEGTRAGELRIQRCASCGTLRHPPSPACGRCGSLERDFVVSAGRGHVYSYVVHHHPPVPGHQVPFVVVLVELEEGTRVVGNLLDTDPAEVRVGQEVQVDFVTVDDQLVLPQWRPVR